MGSFYWRLVGAGLRVFYKLLYHSFAWTYDGVAAIVSIGQWKDWVFSALPYLSGEHILELGHGPGHLQLALAKPGKQSFGLDESRQMGFWARRRLMHQQKPVRLVRGLAQKLPFSNESFDQVVATFPSEYIVHPETLAEVQRVLKPDGTLVIVPGALPASKRLANRLSDGLFKITHQSIPEDLWQGQWVTPFERAGLKARVEFVEQPNSRVIVILAQKPK